MFETPWGQAMEYDVVVTLCKHFNGSLEVQYALFLYVNCLMCFLDSEV